MTVKPGHSIEIPRMTARGTNAKSAPARRTSSTRLEADLSFSSPFVRGVRNSEVKLTANGPVALRYFTRRAYKSRGPAVISLSDFDKVCIRIGDGAPQFRRADFCSVMNFTSRDELRSQ